MGAALDGHRGQGGVEPVIHRADRHVGGCHQRGHGRGIADIGAYRGHPVITQAVLQDGQAGLSGIDHDQLFGARGMVQQVEGDSRSLKSGSQQQVVQVHLR